MNLNAVRARKANSDVSRREAHQLTLHIVLAYAQHGRASIGTAEMEDKAFVLADTSQTSVVDAAELEGRHVGNRMWCFVLCSFV